MAFSSNSAQTREMSELRNHLKWLDEERRKTARKLSEMEQRIAQQGRDLAERDQRIHELEWQLAQVSERVEQMPDMGTGSTGHEQRLQDLEWHMSNINAQLVRLPKLDEELANFREQISQYTVDIENRLVAQQAEAAQRLETDVYARLREDIVQSSAAYDERFVTFKADIDDRLDREIAMSLQGMQEGAIQRLAELEAKYEQSLGRLAELEGSGLTDGERWTGIEDSIQENLGRLANLERATQANLQRLSDVEATLTELKLDDGTLSAIAGLEQELELRQAEELRLANLIGVQESKLADSEARLEELNQVLAEMQTHLGQSDAALSELRTGFKDLNDNWRPALMEATGKVAPLSERLTVLSNSVTKTEANLQTLASDQAEMRESLAGVSDDMRQTRQDLVRQVDTWQATIDEHKETVDRFTQQWLTLSNQYKEARMAVQNFAHWQKQLEQQKREASEMLRVESNRMQSRWEGFLLEIQEQLKNFELDLAQKWQAFEMENEQRWASARRSEQLWREELASIDDLIVKLQQDSRNLIWRVQAAQADAIKKWPRLLLEEVEKAVELNPNRRLQATPGAASVRSDMSVVDAIEQGLIKVDYEDELGDEAQ